MKSITRNLILVAAGVVVLGGAAAALLLTSPAEEEETSSSSSTQTIALISKQEADLASVTVENEYGTFMVEPHTEEVESTVTADDGSTETTTTTKTTYVIEELGDLPFSNYSTEDVFECGFTLNASKDVGEVENLADYGLAEPLATITAEYVDGTSMAYCIGNESAGSNTGRYMCEKDSKHVYVVSIDDDIFNSVADFVDKTLVSVTSSDGTSSPIFTEVKLSGTNFPDPITLSGGETGLVKVSYGEIDTDLDSTEVSNMTAALASISASEAAYLYPTEEQLAECGFEEPRVIAEFTVQGESYKVIVGGDAGDKQSYIMLDGIDVIYKIENSSISVWADTTGYDLRTKFILLPMITDVDRMTVTMDGQEHVFVLSREINEEKSTEDNVVYDYTVTGDGNAITYENFQTYYQSVIMVQLMEETSEEPQGTPEVKVTYEYYEDTGKSADVIEFYAQSDRRYLVTLNGVVHGIASTSSAQMFRDFTPQILLDEELPDIL